MRNTQVVWITKLFIKLYIDDLILNYMFVIGTDIFIGLWTGGKTCSILYSLEIQIIETMMAVNVC